MSAAACAAGYLFASGRLRHLQGAGTTPAVATASSEPSAVHRRCSVCAQRIAKHLWETHMLLAHPGRN